MIKSTRAVVGAVLAATLALVVLPTANASAAAPTFVPSGKMVQRWSPVYMGGVVVVSDTEAVAIAKRFDVIAAHRGTFVGQVPAMKAANARLRLVDYVNAAFAQSGQETKYPDSWYARDVNGNKIQSNNFGNFLMDVSNADWAATVAQECADFVAGDPGFDGCYLDMLGTGPLKGSYLNALPVNPATGQVWTEYDYIKATDAIALAVRRANPSLLITGNGLGWGKRYFDPKGPTSQLWNSLSAATPELFVRGAPDPITAYRSESDWKADVDMLVDAAKRGKVVLALTKVWVKATPAQIDAWHKYALASFLLGTNGKQYFSFLPGKTWAAVTADLPFDRVDVGTPSGSYAKVAGSGIYRRLFTKGIALVNPTSSSYTLSLGGSYKDLGGVTRTRITMAPHTGEVLVKA